MPQVEQMISAYKRNPEPFRAEGWNDLDVKTAIRWTTGAFDGLAEEAMRAYAAEALTAYNENITELGGEPLATTLTAGTQQAPAIDGKSAYKELANLMQDKEVRVALTKRTAGATLSASEVKTLEHHDYLQSANNNQARVEKAAKVTRPPRASINAPTVAPKFKDVDEARARRLEHQNNLSGPYYVPTHPAHAQVRAEVKAAYQLETGETETR